MITRAFWLLALLNTLFLPLVSSQDTPLSYDMKSLSDKEGMILRWLPKDMETWKHCRDNGVLLQRWTVLEQGNELSFPEIEASYQEWKLTPRSQNEWWTQMAGDNLVKISPLHQVLEVSLMHIIVLLSKKIVTDLAFLLLITQRLPPK
jgi:hypothetical protein